MATDADITFTIGLNTSPADKGIAEFQKLLKHNDKINTLNTLRSNASSNYSSLMNAGKWVRSGDTYEVQDYERMLRQQASRIRGLDRTLRQSFTISPREFVLKGDSYYNMPPAVIGRAQTAYNNYAFRRDAFNNMMGRAGQNVLALPAPKTTLEDIELNEFANRLNGNGGRNEFEERNLQKLSLLNERRKAAFDFTQAESDEERNDAIKRYTNADQALKALNQKEKKNKEAKKEIAKEEKNNAKEEKGSLIRFGKMLATLHLIKKVLNSIKDIWKRLSDTELKVTQRDVKEKGIFSVDAYSAMHANVDRSHAVISRGLGYMGAAAPFSMDAFDSVLQQLQDLNLKAISGQGIADDQLVISLQRLSDSLGMGFNIKDILTDPNLNLTEFLTGLMNSVEKFLPKLNSLDDIKKSLVTNDIIKALGPELANALVYNYNYNQRTGGTSTVMEQVTSKGTNAYGLIDYTEEAKKFSQALASTRSALDEFKTALGGVFGPTGKKVANQANEVVSQSTMLLNARKSKISPMNYTLVYSGVTKNGTVDNEELAEWYKHQENQEKAAKVLEGAKDFDSLDDVLNMAYYNPTALSAGTSGSSLETEVGVYMGSRLAERLQGKTFNQLNKKDFSDEEWSAIEEIYSWHNKKKWKFDKNGNDIYNTKAWQKLFDEGGVWDLAYGVSPINYTKKMLGGEEEYQAMIARLLLEDRTFLNEAGLVKEGGVSYYTKDEYDKRGNKISGTVVFKLDLSDGRTAEIPTVIEDGVLKAMANVPSL